MPTAFSPGQQLFLASAGVVTLSELAGRDERGKPGPLRDGERPAFYVLRGPELVACVPIEGAEQTLRELTDPALAAELWQQLVDPADAEPLLDQKPLLERGRDVVHSGSPREQAALLKEMCGLPAPLSDALGSGLRFLADLVLGELGTVLARPVPQLLEELKLRYPAVRELWSRGALGLRFNR